MKKTVDYLLVLCIDMFQPADRTLKTSIFNTIIEGKASLEMVMDRWGEKVSPEVIDDIFNVIIKKNHNIQNIIYCLEKVLYKG
ncbi:hypothetical protein LC087_11100 [Bacillus carboniphilus]|uniref:Uncharacterized protein n=1 Tax=Bacillus carboniphilus TaxID=86663 RepID=A0ABY9JUU2_9BACI|nr:hypothetical protein [Bacillus carboniphilus]WLR41446.1 hypothetical protein LC087_11100 [Bacillus carboniphilus]